MGIKPPKQFRRWLKKAGLHETGKCSWRREFNSGCFQGHGRYWRINCHNCLDMSGPSAQFDRWANSKVASLPMNASNEQQFVSLVKQLLKISQGGQ